MSYAIRGAWPGVDTCEPDALLVFPGTLYDDMDFERKIHEEILQTLERRSRIDIAKLSFVTGLFGIGVIGKISLGELSITLFGTLYVAPFVALAFDCFTLRETWSLRRIGLFLRHCGYQDDVEFERFLEMGRLRNPFYDLGSAGLTLAVIGVSAWLVYYQKSISHTWSWQREDWLWVILSTLFFVLIDILGRFHMHRRFSRKGELR